MQPPARPGGLSRLEVSIRDMRKQADIQELRVASHDPSLPPHPHCHVSPDADIVPFLSSSDPCSPELSWLCNLVPTASR